MDGCHDECLRRHCGLFFSMLESKSATFLQALLSFIGQDGASHQDSQCTTDNRMAQQREQSTRWSAPGSVQTHAQLFTEKYGTRLKSEVCFWPLGTAFPPPLLDPPVF